METPDKKVICLTVSVLVKCYSNASRSLVKTLGECNIDCQSVKQNKCISIL